MAKLYPYEYNGWFLGRAGSEAVAVQQKEDGTGRARRRLGAPYSPIEGAKRALREFVDAQRYVSHGGDPTINEVFDAYLRKLGSENKNTYNSASRMKRIREAIGTLKCSRLNADVCKDFAKTSYTAGYSRHTIWGDLNITRSAMKWACGPGDMLKVPVHHTMWNVKKPGGRLRTLTPDEARALLAACHYPHIRMFVLLGLLTGQRHSAVCELRWDQVDFDKGVVDFRIDDNAERDILDKSSTKGRGVVTMGPTLRAALIGAKAQATTPFVVEFNGKHVLRCLQGFTRARVAAGLSDDVLPHTLRHTAATWASRGVDAATIAKMLGHADVRTTTGVYIKTEAGAAKGAVDAVENVLAFKPSKASGE